MAAREGVAGQSPVLAELLGEAGRYRTVQTVQQWPAVTGTGTALLDRYHTLKKEGEVARVVLRASEELGGALCRSLLLPALRSPVVAGPLRMADWAGGTGAAILQKAVPRLADSDRPLRPGGEMLLRLMLAPLTLCLALTGDLLQAVVDWLVSSFPDLKPAAAGFGDKSLLGQCWTAVLLVGLYLPLQLLVQPARTVRLLVSVPRRVADAVVPQLREASSAVTGELSLWAGAVLDLAIHTISWVAASAQTAYYALFVATGLEPALTAALAWARALPRAARDAAGRITAAPLSGWVRRMLSVRPALPWRRSGGRASSGAAATVSSGKTSPAAVVQRPPPAPEPDLWAPRRVGGALLVTVSLCVAGVAVLSLY